MSKATVITVSDSVSRGDREDVSGIEACRLLREAGLAVDGPVVVADERNEIASRIRDAAASSELVVTTGGTGLAHRDVTPEATREVIEREPGIAELPGREAGKKPRAPSRGVSQGSSALVSS